MSVTFDSKKSRFVDRDRKRDQYILKVFSDGGDNQKIKLVHMFSLQTAGLDRQPDEPDEEPELVGNKPPVQVPINRSYDDVVSQIMDDKLLSSRGKLDEIQWYEDSRDVSLYGDFPDIVDDKEKKKMKEALSRARSTIFELGYCNPWALFFTGTLDGSKYDRSDLDTFRRDLAQFIRNYRKKYNVDIKYLLVPELHSDKENWHIHGLIDGLPVEHLRQFVPGDKMGKKIAKKVLRGEIVYDWGAYSSKFGFCDLEPVRNHEAVSRYISKYITKALERGVQELGKHLYYCSRGLNRATEIAKGAINADNALLGEPSFTSDYCRVWWLDYSAELLEQLANSIIFV